MTQGRALRLSLSLALAVGFAWLLLRHVDPGQIKDAFAGARPALLILATAVFLTGYACRIERWRLMLMRSNPSLRWHTCAMPLLASFAANDILPFRAGDVLRSFAFNRQLGTTSGVVVATVFVERLLDLLMMLVLLGIALIHFGVHTGVLPSMAGAALIGVAVVALSALLFPDFLAPIALALGRLAAGMFPRRGQKLLNEISQGTQTWQHLAQRAMTIKLLIWTTLAWLAEGCCFWFVALALPSVAVPSAAWLAFPVGTLATLIPSTPGSFGTFDYFTARAMTQVGNTAAAATGYTLLVHTMVWLLTVLCGGAYLLLGSIQWSNRLTVSRS